jgi:cystathionine beta-synthase
MTQLPKATNSILNTIGNTPLVELVHTDTGLCRLFVKMENQNPGGSIKDRIGMSMIEAAEMRGDLKPGDTIIEATAGNTGIGLTLVGKLKGYKVKLVIPDKMSQEKINHLKAMGAEIILTRSDVGKGHPEYYQDVAERISREKGAYYINQFSNPDNPLAHENTTAPEIWEQMEHNMDAIVLGVGSSGTVAGMSAFFKTVSPTPEIILADPEGSILADYINDGNLRTDAGSWLVEGIGEDFIPSISDFSLVKKAYTVSDKESFEAVRDLLQNEGILAGSSTGTLLSAAIRYCKEQTTPKRVVTLICDSGNKYLSKMFNDFWLMDKGILKTENFGDLRDFATRLSAKKGIETAKPEETLDKVYGRMKLYDFSQIPVIDQDNKVVGMIDESDLLDAIFSKKLPVNTSVAEIMSKQIISLAYNDNQEKMVEMLNNGYLAIITDENEQLYGVVTKIDVLTRLFNQAKES